MAKGLVVVSNLLPEEKLLLLLDLPGFLLFLEVCRQDHGSREMKNLHPQGQMSGPGLSLRGRTSREQGAQFMCLCRVSGRLCCQPVEASHPHSPFPGE